jgi:hypothetical protein
LPRNYSIALFVLTVIEYVGWLTIGMMGLAIFSDRSLFDEPIEWILTAAVCGAGMLIIAVVQIARAQIHTAISTAATAALLQEFLSTRKETIQPSEPNPKLEWRTRPNPNQVEEPEHPPGWNAKY